MSAKFYCNNKECKKGYYFEVPDEINMAVFAPIVPAGWCSHSCHTILASINLPKQSADEALMDERSPSTGDFYKQKSVPTIVQQDWAKTAFFSCLRQEDKEMENAFLAGCLIVALALLVWLFFKYR